MPSLTPAERETVITTDDDSDVVRIWTAQRTYITKLRKHPAFTEVESGFYGKTEWADFTIPAGEWSPLGPVRRRNLTDKQREELRDRLLAAKGA